MLYLQIIVKAYVFVFREIYDNPSEKIGVAFQTMVA